MPAAGPLVPILFTFAGTANRSRIPGMAASRFQCTPNGWADEVSWVIWCKMFVEHIQSRGFTRALLYCDNAALHYNKVGIAILARANDCVITLIPQCTGRMQPLDNCFFGALKRVHTPRTKISPSGAKRPSRRWRRSGEEGGERRRGALQEMRPRSLYAQRARVVLFRLDGRSLGPLRHLARGCRGQEREGGRLRTRPRQQPRPHASRARQRRRGRGAREDAREEI
jgi:hypothetical protein